MTFNQLFIDFQKKYDNTHDVIFFELLFAISKQVKNKEQFVECRNKDIDFKQKKFDKMCKKYFVKQCPLAHITGHTIFCSLDFVINRKVLSPRDVTEQMVQDFIDKHKNDKEGQVLDLCCGSGCICVSIKKHIPQFSVKAVDKYWNAILNTRTNGIKHKTPLTIDCMDAIKYLNHISSAEYIISNPPYINPNNFDNKKMFKWESKKALLAQDNGLFFYKQYFAWLSKHTFKEAWFEIGYDQAEQLNQEITKYPDLQVFFPKNRQYIIVKRKY